jgi:hypothetical protein
MLQRTPEWHLIRCGRVTGSRITDVLAELADKKKEPTSRRNYRRELVLERWSKVSKERNFQTFAMAAGIAAQMRGKYMISKIGSG